LHRSRDGSVHNNRSEFEFEQFDDAAAFEHKPVHESNHGPADPELNHANSGSAEPDHAVEHISIQHDVAGDLVKPVQHGHYDPAAFEYKSVQHHRHEPKQHLDSVEHNFAFVDAEQHASIFN
jgi:hypothetical protein